MWPIYERSKKGEEKMNLMETDLKSRLEKAIEKEDVQEATNVFLDIKKHVYGKGTYNMLKDIYFEFKVKELNKHKYRKHR